MQKMILKTVRTVAAVFIALVLCSFCGIASAEIIDDIKLNKDANGDTDAYIKFTVPIQNLRYFPPRKSQYLVIYFKFVDSVSRDRWQGYERHRSPPSDVILDFTISTRDLNVGPKVEVKFNRPVEYTLKAGRDGRSLHLHIKSGLPPQKREKETGAAIASIPKTAVPEVSSGNGVNHTHPSAPSRSQQLGGKDGLPLFPVIDETARKPGSVPPTGDLTLAEQIKKANSEAAVLMAKGRDALLAGEMFAAIEAFNNTLKLPPNKYTQDAQVWVGIAREKSGQVAKAKLEYESYLKLYPNGSEAKWVKDRLAKLNAIMPAPPSSVPLSAPVVVQNREFEFTEYGSFSLYYYHGLSHTDTTTTTGTVQTPFSQTVTDQSSLIGNISVTARSFNGEYDNRMVFQDYYAANFLPGQENRNRLNALFYDLNNRRSNYSARIGRQSALGGGVLGRFDGASAGYGFLPDWRANAVAGQLSDYQQVSSPVFYGASLDFGVKSQLGGSVYDIKQTVNGLPDRHAVGGDLRYFEQGKTALALVDYDIDFRALNMITLQGTLNLDSGTDLNFYIDHRRAPTLSIQNAVYGTTSSIDILLQNGWTIDDLRSLAKLRTGTANMAQFGFTTHLNGKWQIGTDLIFSNASGLPASGTLNPDFTTGLEGYVPETPSSGTAWIITERLIGSGVITSRDVSLCSLSVSRSPALTGTTLLLNNHSLFGEQWELDSTLRLYWQTYNGDKEYIVAPLLKLGYRVKTYLTLETEGGVEFTNVSPVAQPVSDITRQYYSVGFRWDF
jgi:tetratricopeptide (TPR) repeat protein